jgi:hypothetical protein
MKDPGLGFQGGVPVDGKRTGPGHLFHEVDSQVQSFEARRYIEAKRGLSHAVASHESDLHGLDSFLDSAR